VLVGFGLRPLQQLSDEVGALAPGAPPGSLHLQGLPRELVPIARRIDDLLARMQAALERERRVSANMAHELRTPVSELQSLTEVAMRWPEGEEHRARALATAHAIARRMSALTEAVLRLSQPEPDRIEVANARFDLGALVLGLLGADDPGREPVQVDIADNVTVTSDQVAVRIVLSNLIDNARKYGGDGPIRCNLHRIGDDVEFCISNPAGKLTGADLPRLGERFWRGDRSRTSNDRPHFGLGLAIAREICSRIGARLTHRLAAGRLEACLRLPATTR
jgi:two-component system sensor histidine kinase QseC